MFNTRLGSVWFPYLLSNDSIGPVGLVRRWYSLGMPIVKNQVFNRFELGIGWVGEGGCGVGGGGGGVGWGVREGEWQARLLGNAGANFAHYMMPLLFVHELNDVIFGVHLHRPTHCLFLCCLGIFEVLNLC